jgi:phosphocarrier protein HPr
MKVAQRQVTVGPGVGLHARPAAVFVQAAGKAPADVFIGRPGGEPVNAKSILAVLGLDVRGGEDVVLSTTGAGADDTLDRLAALLGKATGD